MRQGNKNDYRGQTRELETRGITIYTDGACDPNPGVGGWGFVVYRDGIEIHRAFGGERSSTNNIMEMTAVLQALLWIQQNVPADQPEAIIYCDSQYVVNGTTKWCAGWERRGWTKKGGPILNLELWKWIHSLFPTLPVVIEWIRGHAGTDGNEIADWLAVKGRASVLAPESRR